MSRFDVLRTWRLPLHRIVVSGWLKSTLEDSGIDAVLVPNGIDLNVFSAVTAMGDRRSDLLAMVSPYPWKRSDLFYAVVNEILAKKPRARIMAFGVGPRPSELDARVSYVMRPPPDQLVRLYQDARVFLTVSDFEGFGLPALEAMACGCVIVTTDNGGVPSFAGDAAIVVQRSRSDQAAEAVLDVLSDSRRELEMRGRGLQTAEHFSVSRSRVLFAEFIDNVVLRGND